MRASEIRFNSGLDSRENVFQAEGDGYHLTCLDGVVEFHVDRLARDRDSLKGELTVYAGLKGAHTVDGVLSFGLFNFSTSADRYHLGQKLKAAARTSDDVNWSLMLEELCIRVAKAEREGKPAQPLTAFPLPPADDTLPLDGLYLPAQHPSILFGDGGTGKSYLALWLAGRLAQRGIATLYCDWELSGADHRERLEKLFGPDPPLVHYLRADRPMVVEADRIRRAVAEIGAQYVVCDSIAFACHGRPEDAEVAGAYFRAVRQFGDGVGSLHLAHVVKSRDTDNEGKPARELRPFGSTFWHNGARSIWYLKRADQVEQHGRIVTGAYHTKCNLGALRPAVGFELLFGDDRTLVDRIDVGDVAELAARLPVGARLSRALRGGPMTIAALAEEIEAKPDTIEKTLKRGAAGHSPRFVCLPGGNGDGVHRWALAETRAA